MRRVTVDPVVTGPKQPEKEKRYTWNSTLVLSMYEKEQNKIPRTEECGLKNKCLIVVNKNESTANPRD